MSAVPAPLIALHGFTMNGTGLRHMTADLERRLVGVVDFIYPDAPNLCSEESVASLASLMGGFRAKPPNLEWWNASADGHTYRGWDASRDLLRSTAQELVVRHPSSTSQPSAGIPHGVGLFGFSQGAALAAALAAMAQRGEFPNVLFVVLVAGFCPRARDLERLFDAPIELPSLHVWGDSDAFARYSPQLLERFAPHSRQVLKWPGRHAVPTGDAADALAEFVRLHASAVD